MKVNFLPQPILMEKAIEALVEKLGLAKATEFWSFFGYGRGDYTRMRRKIFQKETLESLYKKIEDFQNRKE